MLGEIRNSRVRGAAIGPCSLMAPSSIVTFKLRGSIPCNYPAKKKKKVELEQQSHVGRSEKVSLEISWKVPILQIP